MSDWIGPYGLSCTTSGPPCDFFSSVGNTVRYSVFLIGLKLTLIFGWLFSNGAKVFEYPAVSSGRQESTVSVTLSPLLLVLGAHAGAATTTLSAAMTVQNLRIRR